MLYISTRFCYYEILCVCVLCELRINKFKLNLYPYPAAISSQNPISYPCRCDRVSSTMLSMHSLPALHTKILLQ